jgi:hypothetical protein
LKTLVAVLGFAALTSTAFAAEYTGYLSDEQCAAGGAKSKTAAEWIKPAAFEGCVKKCVKAGSAVVFVTEDNKIVKIDAKSMEKVEPQLGHKVKVTGKIEDGTLKIDTISQLPL